MFVEEDSEGDVEQPPVRSQKARQHKRVHVGAVKKNADQFVVNHTGDWLKAANGGQVKINLAKFILTRVDEDMVEDCKMRRVVDYEKNPIGVDHYRCLLSGAKGHHEFIKVGTNTGNLKKHCDTHHELQLAAIARVIEETPKEETAVKVREFITTLAAPSSDLRRFFVRRDKTSLEQELCAFVWVLDSQVPFAQLDNPLFKNFIASMGHSFGSAKTMLDSILPLMYEFATGQQANFLRSCIAFTTSYDGWSRFNSKFLSQNYHCIYPGTFEYRILLLDLIPLQSQHFSEVISGALRYRQDIWTAESTVIAAMGISDCAANMLAASSELYEDFERCQNHRIKKVYELGEAHSGQYLRDFNCIVSLCSHAATNANVSDVMRTYQYIHDLSELHFVLYNETRWEGRFLTVDRFYALRESLVCFEQLPLVGELREKVSDFLRPAFFVRLNQYLLYLRDLNDVSLLYQTQKFPTGCLVPLCVRFLQMRMEPSPDDVVPKYLVDFKSSFADAIASVLVEPILGTCNGFLKAALFHPGIAPHLPSFVQESVLHECWNAIECDMETISSKNKKFGELALGGYREFLTMRRVDPLPDIVLSTMKDGGYYAGYRPLEFWQSIANHREGENEFGGLYLVPVASMVLALPAGESVDEFTFSSAQRTLTKERNRLSPTHIEQITVVRMFIRNFGWTPAQLSTWIREAQTEHDRRVAQSKARPKASNNSE